MMDREKDEERVSSRLKMEQYARISDLVCTLLLINGINIMLFILIHVFHIHSKAVMTAVEHN